MATPISNSFFGAAFYQEAPVIYCPFRENAVAASTAYDIVNGYQATVHGGVTFAVTGPLSTLHQNTAITLDGTSGYLAFTVVGVGMTATILPTMSLSFSCWAKFTVNSGVLRRFIFFTDVNGVELSLGMLSKQIVWQSDTLFTKTSAAATYNDGNWHFLVGVLNGLTNQATLYIDGVAETPAAASAINGFGATQNLYIGWDTGATSFFPGSLAHVAIYPYALSASAISALYAARLKVGGGDTFLTQARSGVARSGATRAGGYPSRLIVKIGATDIADRTQSAYGPVKGSVKVSQVLSTQPNTSRFSMFDKSGTHAPTPGQTLVVADGAIGNPIFTGTIIRTRSSPAKSVDGVKAVANFFDVDAQDATWLFNRRTITKQYPAGTVGSAIAVDIINNAISAGFNVTGKCVQAGSPSLSAALSFKGEKFGDAMTQLCQSLNPNWQWKFDPNGIDIHFFQSENNRTRPIAVVPGVASYDQLDFTLDLSQIRSRITSEGGGGSTTAGVTIGATSIPVNECSWYDPSAFVGGLGQVVSGSQNIIIQFTGRSATSGPGNITGVPASGVGAITVPLPEGDVLDVWVQSDDAAAQAAIAALEGGDGVHEFVQSVSGATVAQCLQQNVAALAAYKSVLVTGTLWSTNRAYTEGTSINVILPNTRATAVITATVMQVDRSLLSVGRWQLTVTFGTLFRNIVDVLRRVGQAA